MGRRRVSSSTPSSGLQPVPPQQRTSKDGKTEAAVAAEIVEAAKLNGAGKAAEEAARQVAEEAAMKPTTHSHGLRVCFEEKCLQNRVKPRLYR